MACGHLVLNTHPLGGESGLGASPAGSAALDRSRPPNRGASATSIRE
jgi:hypothetical protein